MKKIFLLLFVFSFLGNSKAQITTPFPDTSASWTVETSYYDFPNWYYDHVRYFVCGDTLINGYKYYSISNLSNPSDTICSNLPVYRIDSLKVYFWVDDSTEVLKYDFGMQIGDSILVDNGTYGFLSQIDTVTINTGQEVTRYLITGNAIDSIYWFYGIGGEYGPFQNAHWFGPYPNLSSFYINGDCYFSSNYCSANLTAIGEKSDVEEEISIYPNPSNGKFTLETDNYQNAAYEILDLNGKIVSSSKLNNRTKEVNLDVANGIYWVRIINKDGVQTKKLVINE